MFFAAKDQGMQRNMVYYRFFGKQWGLEETHFLLGRGAWRYFTQTAKQREMLEFALNYLQTDDEGVVSPEEVAAPSAPPDAEFEGIGDYEESFVADWWQEPKTKGDAGEPAA